MSTTVSVSRSVGWVGFLMGLLVTAELVMAETSEAGTDADAVAGAVDQWADFPTGRTIEFSGYTWRVKGADAGQTYGPGGFAFGTTEQSVWVDDDGRLHLRVFRDEGGTWYSAEVRLTEFLGHGDYRFTTAGPVQTIDPNLIFGLFIWEYQPSYEGVEQNNVANEFDIEFGNWKDPERLPSQFVCQPWQADGTRSAYVLDVEDADALSTHAFRWLPDRVECRAWIGGPDAEGEWDAQRANWTYFGPHVPGGAPQVHLNLWCNRDAPASGEPQEVVIERFEFVPAAR